MRGFLLVERRCFLVLVRHDRITSSVNPRLGIKYWVIIFSLLKETLIANRLKWLGHVLHMHTERLLCSVLFSEAGCSWNVGRGALSITRQKM